MFHCKFILDYLKKWKSFLLKNNSLTINEKIRIISALDKGVKDSIIRSCVMQRLQTSTDGNKFFDFSGHKIFFQPGYKVKDNEYYMSGIVSVLIETFLLPEYFTSKVNIKKGDIVFDLGSNIGTTAMLFSRIIGEQGKLFAFEPVTYETLSFNIQANNLRNVEIIPKGVSDKPGKSEIEISDYGLDSSIAKREHTKGYYQYKKNIELISLDDFVQENEINRIDFIKMDIEGSEELAIRGAVGVIGKYRPKWSISSYHIDWENKFQHKKLVGLLKGMDYRVEEVGEKHIYAW